MSPGWQVASPAARSESPERPRLAPASILEPVLDELVARTGLTGVTTPNWAFGRVAPPPRRRSRPEGPDRSARRRIGPTNGEPDQRDDVFPLMGPSE